MSDMNLSELAEPFPPDAVEWRIGRAGEKNGRIWAKVLAYIESRAIMDRLDDVCGPAHWQTRYTTQDGHITCEIGIRVDGEWIWKGDGAGYLEATGALSATDAGKGDYSNALKRAGIEWGIGRYLYGLDEGWADVNDDGEKFARLKDGTGFKWDPPDLPAWALPEGFDAPEENVDTETGEISEPDGDVADSDLPAAVADKLERASSLGIIKGDRKENIGRAIEKEDLDVLRIAHDWLERQIEAKKMDASHEPEQGALV